MSKIKYSDCANVENMTVSSHVIDGSSNSSSKDFSCENEMSTEEKLEFLTDFDKKYEDKIKELEMLFYALNANEVKTAGKCVNNIHMKSVCSWIKRTGAEHIYIRSEYSTSRLGINVCGYFYGLRDAYDVNTLAKNMHGDKMINNLFKKVLNDLYKKEIKYKNEMDAMMYDNEHSERIEAGTRAYAAISKLDISVPFLVQDRNVSSFSNKSEPYVAVKRLGNLTWAYSSREGDLKAFGKNSHDELTYDGNIIDEDTARMLEKIVTRYGMKIASIIDDMKEELKNAVENG